MVEPVAARLEAPVVWVMGNHDDRAAFRSELWDDEGRRPSPRRPRRRVRRPAHRPPRHLRARAPLRRDQRRAVGLAARHGARHPGAAGHDPRHASPPVRACSRSRRAWSFAIRRGWLACCAAPTSVRSSPGTSTTRRSRPSPASPSPSPRRLFTHRISPCRSAGTRPQDGAQSYNLVHVYDDTVVHSVVPRRCATRHGVHRPQTAQRLLAEADHGRRRAAAVGPADNVRWFVRR